MVSPLEGLVGLKIEGVLAVHDYYQICLEKEITPNVYSDFRVPGCDDVDLLEGVKVMGVNDVQATVALYMSGDTSILGDLRDEA